MSGVTSGLEFSMLEREEGHVFTHCFMATLFLSQAYIHAVKRMRSTPVLNT